MSYRHGHPVSNLFEFLWPWLPCQPSMLYCTALHSTAQRCAALYCTVLYCTVLYCTVLYCTVLNTNTYEYILIIIVRDIIETAAVLHNLIRRRIPIIPVNDVDHEDEDHNLVPGNWRNDIQWQDMDAPPEGRNRATLDSKQQREYLKRYFNSPAGAVGWQDIMITPL